jgi:RimJ/RimL family protein N-acetyltransferase
MTVVLETERLILRPPEQGDLDGWARFDGDAESMRYLGGPLARSEAWRMMAAVAGMWSLLGFGQFSVIEKARGAWVGRAGPWYPEGWPGREVGWMLLPEVRGHGYATEAATAAMDFAFETLGWDRVIHVIDPRNTASHAVARRLGSALIGPVTLPGSRRDWPVEAWGQTRYQWRAGRAIASSTSPNDTPSLKSE